MTEQFFYLRNLTLLTDGKMESGLYCSYVGTKKKKGKKKEKEKKKEDNLMDRKKMTV